MAERGGEGKRLRGTVCFFIRDAGQIRLKDSRSTVIDVSYEDIIVNPVDPKCLMDDEEVEFQLGVKKGITHALHVTGPNGTPIPKRFIDRSGTVRLAKGSGGGGGGGGTGGGGSSSGSGGGGSHGDGGGVV